MTAALFGPQGDNRFLATDHAVGPWDPHALHGGAPSALAAGVLEAEIAAADLGVEWQPVRFSAELLRPVPLAELTVTATVRRPGRRICVADATIAGPDGKVALAATLECIRRAPFDHGVATALITPPGPDTGVAMAPDGVDTPAFHRTGTDHRFVAGTSFEARGPATDWIRLAVPVIEGQVPSPLQRAVAAADFGNGISGLFSFEDMLYLNPDLTVLLYRVPVGEWIGLDAKTELGPDGVGMAESVLYDETGPIGRAVQMLLVEPR